MSSMEWQPRSIPRFRPPRADDHQNRPFIDVRGAERDARELSSSTPFVVTTAPNTPTVTAECMRGKKWDACDACALPRTGSGCPLAMRTSVWQPIRMAQRRARNSLQAQAPSLPEFLLRRLQRSPSHAGPSRTGAHSRDNVSRRRSMRIHSQNHTRTAPHLYGATAPEACPRSRMFMSRLLETMSTKRS